MSRLAQEKDPEILHKAIELLQNHNRVLTAKIEELLAALKEAKGESVFQQLRLAALEQHLAKLTKQVFGPTSEQRTTDAEPDGASADGDDKSEDDDDKKKKRRGHGPKEQPKLPVIEVEHDLDDPDKVCPNCGGCLHEMEGQY